MSKMHIRKISEICDFWLKTRFFTNFFFRLKRCPLSCEFGTENRFELRALVQILQRFKTLFEYYLNGNLHYVIKNLSTHFKKRCFEKTRAHIQKRISVSYSQCKGKHFKRKKIFWLKNVFFTKNHRFLKFTQSAF